MDVVGPAQDPLPRAGAVIATHIAPFAEDVDRQGVRREAIDALAAAGLLGEPLEPALQRELGEVIAAADASTWFCWVQHQSPLRALAAARPTVDTPAVEVLQSRWLDGLRSGALLAGVAFAHLRRPGPPNPVATRVSRGWRIDGTLDWVTSWDIADVVLVMARAGQSVVSFLLPAGRTPGLPPGVAVGEPLRLLAMSGTHTRPVVFSEAVIPDAWVVDVQDLETWRRGDALRSADANPAAFGVTRGALGELAELAEQSPGAQALVDSLAEECRSVRRAAYALADVASDANRTERLELRAASLDLVMRATTAVVIARAGSAMRLGASAERRAREALFLQVQAQTEATRAASLARMVSGGR